MVGDGKERHNSLLIYIELDILACTVLINKKKIITWNHVCGHLTSLNIPIYFSSVFWTPPSPEGNVWLFSIFVLNSVHRLGLSG